VIHASLEAAEAEIGTRVGESDVRFGRVNHEAHGAGSIELSRREYNKRFGIAQRLDPERLELARELESRALAVISTSRLASECPFDAFGDVFPSGSVVAAQGAVVKEVAGPDVNILQLDFT